MREEFDSKLLESENPFPYPEPSPRPSFIVGGESYLKWFGDTYRNRTRQDGTSCFFIVGSPGSGKTHLLRHLGYLFYDENAFKGIYSVSRLSDQEIDEREIWKQLLLAPDSLKRLTSLVPEEKIQNSDIRQDVKTHIIKLHKQQLDMDLLSIETIRKIAEAISNLLPEESIFCITLDNIEEYLTARENEYCVRAKTVPEGSTKENAVAEAVKSLVDKTRNMTSDLRKAIVLLALTTPAWAEVRKTDPARTKARRFKFSEEQLVLNELTLPQTYDLVSRYLQQWCLKESATLPNDIEECKVGTSAGPVSIYPFTELAVELAWKVTDRLAGDITCFCSESINMMKNRGRVEVIKDELTVENLLKITKEYPWLGWTDHAKVMLEEFGPKIMEKSLARRMSELVTQKRTKYSLGISSETIVADVDRFVGLLGVSIPPTPSVENWLNANAPLVVSNPLLRIWKFKDSRIAVRYVIGEKQQHVPESRLFGGLVKQADYVDILSLIESGQATHGILVLLWAVEDQSRINDFLRGGIRELGPTLITIDLSTEIFKVIAVAETADDQEDLAKMCDKIYLNLSSKLSMLVQQEKPLKEPDKRKFTADF